ncbi:lyase family protein [Roseibium sp. SCPC15]|uniref:lyase family protein n=1 Tax=Roseibium sp. SCP15 TaxID=3141376 RepID=UPI0033395485
MLSYDLYKDCLSTETMRNIWSEAETIASWLRVEQALARAQADHELIPQEAADRIGEIVPAQIDAEELKQEMMLVGRPIVGLVRQLKQLVGDHAGRVHFRATTQDIMDTALALQMKSGLSDVTTSVLAIIALVEHSIEKYGSAEIIGRTNGQYAVPVQLSLKLTLWREELARRLEAIEQAADRGLNVQIGGPVGDLRGYEASKGMHIKQAVAKHFGLGVITPHWQNTRDGVFDVTNALGSLCATLCKIAHNINLLASSDIAEASERHTNGRGASSAMAHKRNQRASEFAEALARLGRQRTEQMGELTLHQHERSGGVWIGEWLLVPEIFLLTAGALHWTTLMFSGLQFHTDQMQDRIREFQSSKLPANATPGH